MFGIGHDPNLAPPYLDLMRPRPTGNVIVVFGDEGQDDQLRTLERVARRSSERRSAMAHLLSFEDLGAVDTGALAEPILLDGYGIGLIPATQSSAMQVASDAGAETGVVESRPEFFLYADFDWPSDTAARTWGVAAVGAEASGFGGQGIRIAVLDTWLDTAHPDFTARNPVCASFVAGQSAERDVSGHGTHCAGTAAGPRARGSVPRYGVAPEADIFAGKVLGDDGRGLEIDTLTGMVWAIEAGCEVISMSLSFPVQPNQRYSMAFENLARRALDRGCLIVAAAGNFSSRHFGYIAPVTGPANCPSILAVAAIDTKGGVASFSCGGVNPDGGEVDIAAPGVDVFSAYPRPRDYRSLQGTSMACPHVAGVAALWAETDPALRGRALAAKLKETAMRLSDPPRDVGAGLVQAPQ